jgi:hypothetical protein
MTRRQAGPAILIAVLLVWSLGTSLVATPQTPQTSGATGVAAKATAKIAGRVTSLTDGKPIRWAVLRVVSFDVMRVAKSASTDADGRFSFETLLPGRYQLSVTADGFVSLQFGQSSATDAGRPIDLTEGLVFDAANFSLMKTSAIEGRILDEFGDPAPGVMPVLFRADFIAGRRRLVPVGSRIPAQPTDDQGHFRIFGLAPGTYYVGALSGAFSSESERGGFATTFFPGATDAAAAVPLVVDMGADRTDAIFALVPAQTAALGGAIVDEQGAASPAMVVLTPADSLNANALVIARASADPAGRFLFRAVPPGKYTLQAFGPSSTGALGTSPFGYAPVTMDGRDRTDAKVTIHAGRHLRGTITFEGTAPRPAADAIVIDAGAIEFDSSPVVGGGPPQHRINSDWTFDTGNMSGERVMRVSLATSAWVLKQVTLNGVDVTDTPIDLREKDADGLEVVLTDRVSMVTGAVSDAEGRASADCSVIVFSNDPARWTFPSRYVVGTRPNQQGSFKVAGLPPGRYVAAAVPVVAGTVWQDPELLGKLRPLATPFTLAEGGSASLTLKIVKPR